MTIKKKRFITETPAKAVRQKVFSNLKNQRSNLRILQINSARSIGGGERHLIDLTKGLVERGHDVYVALSPRSRLREELTKILPEENLFFVPMRNALDIFSARKLARFISEREIEIAHAHLGRDYPLAAFAIKKQNLAKLVLTRHVLFPLSRFHRFTSSIASKVIAVSHAVGNNLIQQGVFPAERIRVVPNGIDIKTFDTATHCEDRANFRKRLNIASDSSLVGIIGELTPHKGQEEFIRAAAKLSKEFTNAHFVIAGNGKHRHFFEQLSAELNIADRIHFTGWLDDIGTMLRAIDVSISASRWEPFGLVIVEAMASGAPVVATMSEGACEIIEHEKTGLLVPIGDVEAITGAIESLLKDKEKRDALARAARQIALELYSLETMIEATENVYHQAIGLID